MSTVRKISEAEQQRRARQRAMSVDQFCREYGLGRTTTYEEIKTGRLRARKCGKRTIISEDDAEDWLRCLPMVAPDTQALTCGA
jgi:excisionase family DNA binding protein